MKRVAICHTMLYPKIRPLDTKNDAGPMIEVSYVTPQDGFLHFRLTPHGDGRVEEFHFLPPDKAENPDILVVCDDPCPNFITSLPRERRFYLITEPEAIKRLQPGFLAQFGTIIGPYRPAGFSGKFQLSPPCIPWFYGVDLWLPLNEAIKQTYQDLQSAKPGEKKNALSLVISKKQQTPFHRARLKLAEALMRALPDQVEVFGNGFRPIGNKAEALDPFRYHLALENNEDDHFWTEKMADPLLGFCLPIYAGTRKIGDYFPQNSFIPIDVRDTEACLARIKALLAEDPWEKHLPHILAARRLLLETYAPFTVIARAIRETIPLASSNPYNPAQIPILLRKNSDFKLKRRLLRPIRALFGRD
jgi:Glycosyltransferase family 10 (fucosyltransferase) C-term